MSSACSSRSSCGPVRGRPLRAHRRRAALAGGPAGRAAQHPGPGQGARRHRLARAGRRREPPPRGPQPARGGGRLPAAHRGVRPHPRAGRRPGSARAGPRSRTRCGSSSCRRRCRSSSPRASSPPGTPRRCWARRTGPSSSTWPGGSCAEGLTVRDVGRRCVARTSSEAGAAGADGDPAATTAARGDRRGAGAGRDPGLLELEELLAPFLETRVPIQAGEAAGASSSSSSPTSRTSSASTAGSPQAGARTGLNRASIRQDRRATVEGRPPPHVPHSRWTKLWRALVERRTDGAGTVATRRVSRWRRRRQDQRPTALQVAVTMAGAWATTPPAGRPRRRPRACGSPGAAAPASRRAPHRPGEPGGRQGRAASELGQAPPARRTRSPRWA